MGIIKEVVLTPLKIIENPAGNILHAMKASDQGYAGFGEAYFSTVDQWSGKRLEETYEDDTKPGCSARCHFICPL